MRGGFIWEGTFLTIPMQFLRMLQMLKSFLENIGAGRLVLNKQERK